MLLPCALVSIAAVFPYTSLASNYNFDKALEKSRALEPRTLKAAAREFDIARRGSGISVKNDVTLHYIDVCYP